MPFSNSSGKTAARYMVFLFLLPFAGTGSVSAQKLKDLKPQGYVSDFAKVLSAAAKQKLTALCQEVDTKAGAQIAVVTVSSLEGEAVEQYAFDLASQWGVGPKQQSRGVLILVAPNDHKYWTEVGYGLEPILPDGKVGGFGREAVPLLRQNDYDGAVILLTTRVASVIAQDKGVTLGAASGTPPPVVTDDSNPSVLRLIRALPFLIIIFIVLMRLLFSRSGRRGGGWWIGPFIGGGLGGGGFGGGGGGGGGFGGFGGGSFGGGGAGGSW